MKKAAAVAAVAVTGVAAFIYIGVDQVLKNTGKPPKKPRHRRAK